MQFYSPLTKKELSQKKQEEWNNYCNIIIWGRKNPIKFMEEIFGLKGIDYQTWIMSKSWITPFCCWLESRGAGKDTKSSMFNMTKMLLVPDYRLYVSTLSSAQSAESFKKLEDIALQRIPSFKSATDIFAREIETNPANPTGFSHDKSGNNFRLFNNSQMVTLSSNLETIRGKRGSVWFNECGWMTNEHLAVAENFANVDSNFSTSTSKVKYYRPEQMPLQLLYTSSASDVTYPFYEKYKTFSINMIKGDNNFFCCDIDAHDILYHSTIDGIPIKSHLSEDIIQKSIEEDPDLAERELFNKFRKGSGQNAVVSMDTLIQNSVIRKPILFNETGKKKYLICYDPARNYDGSILGIFEIVDDKQLGYKLKVANVISMVDTSTKNKTPLPMTQQLEIIKETMIKYNGERVAEWENIEFYIDSGSGGGGISAVADQLMDDWVDSIGQKHRGIIDGEHKQYNTARTRYTKAMPIVHLIDPQGYKKIIYDALAKMTKLNLIEFTSYDNKDYILIENKNGEFETYNLSEEEKISLQQINLMKTEVSYMCRYDNANGGVQYELSKDKKNTMHDDRSYVLALGAYALALLRRTDLIELKDKSTDFSKAPRCISSFSY